MLNAIKKNGYIVLQNVLNEAEIQTALSFLPKIQETGFVFSLTHSSFANHLRNHPKIKAIFQQIWETKDLTPSLDCPIIWTSAPTHIENMHLDQNPYHKPDFQCVQGLLHLTTTSLGGLQVVEKSNTAHLDIIEKYPEIKDTKEDWLELGDEIQGYKIPTKSGTMILWDSRTIHGGYIGTPSLIPRISFPICMRPSGSIDSTLRKRAMDEKRTLNHWGNAFHKKIFI